MLSATTRDIVTQTVPVLEAGGEALTRHFYNYMLSHYPEVRPLFNQANQVSGTQPRALASAILNYAKHINRLEALGPLVGQIVSKHVSLQILPEHYPIVGTCLLQAIKDVLGDAATDDIINAWAEAYQFLADLLIGAEEKVYAGNAEAAGGWRGARAFRLVRKQVESDEITSFYFEPVDGNPILAHQPGQYIGLQVWVDGVEQRRNYSLSAAPNSHYYRISVKREAQGAVSNYLHDQLSPGQTINLFPPTGELLLQPGSGPVALLSAGVGITPTLPILQQALSAGRDVVFIHYARHRGVEAFRDELDQLQGKYPAQLQRYRVLEQHDEEDQADDTGRIYIEQLQRWLPDHEALQAYFIGPAPFMQAARHLLKDIGVSEDRQFYEFFGPAQALN
ncbi:NO-inducible flavohemoprotein [Pokkaliibacter sp. MBI-7]|uniref:NO-inducible flavohemoprotein n=1 Tax=Pokkaliibacter sp. MBI-7 TaxID=3040600 RepID=UPI0024480718|nr:NO-inducible flavohemoprotein [Pokkaliibacter sp. MBI-7]MDH2431715.1 NO-inducible flavohemoprotein [Pokkaliibacter sp. MBI-7]